MAVKRVVANVAADDVATAQAFYGDVLDMRVAMALGWIVTSAVKAPATPQLSVASEGGSRTFVPDLSIEVDNLDEVHRRAVAGGFVIAYGPVTEPSGVRRFNVRDPFGRLVNILAHAA
jgi:catechol 2,3-dioxygenase-like lactoylglutathione lyase family enzyme